MTSSLDPGESLENGVRIPVLRCFEAVLRCFEQKRTGLKKSYHRPPIIELRVGTAKLGTMGMKYTKVKLEGSGWKMSLKISSTGACLTSNLVGEPDAFSGLYSDTQLAFQAVEAVVLAHACAGVKVDAQAYIKGLDTAIEVIANNLG